MPATASVVDPAACALAALTQHIRETHHAFLRAELPALWELLREAAAARRATTDELRTIGRLFGQFRATLDNHLRKEEEVLFPFIEQLETRLGEGQPAPKHVFGPLRLPIEVLEEEHALGDRLLAGIRPIWSGWTESRDPSRVLLQLHDRFAALEDDMARHVHVEDAILFPRTVSLEGR
ncbi:MAG TPA: hemerythrin domain-containing protein [Vicinamibacterales bacterium]|nr:hemerythrin domain-containing protein [Vicinamibacterales bacterium]